MYELRVLSVNFLFYSRTFTASRGNAILFFETVADCRQFVESWAGRLQIADTYVQVHYFKGSDKEWKCIKCAQGNYIWRTACFVCGVERPREQDAGSMVDSAGSDGTHDVCMFPSPVVIIKDLDVLTSEEALYDALAEYGPILEVRLIKDRITHTSQGVGFAYFTDVYVR